MSNSSSLSESLAFGGGLAALLLGGAALQWYQVGFSATTLVWLLLALALLAVWVRRQTLAERYLHDMQEMTRDVALGNFGRLISNIPIRGRFHSLCWDMNDMLDQLEACFREQATALTNASEARYFRKAQPVGLRGAFNLSLERTNQSLTALEEKEIGRAHV